MSDNRRLLFVAPSAYPVGGVATWLDYLLPGLEEKGWQPVLGLVSGKYHDPDRYLQCHPYHRVVRIANPTGSHEGRVRALSAAVQDLEPCMVLSVNIPDSFMAVARLRRRGKSCAKVVMTLHGILDDLLGDARAFCSVLDAVVCTNRLTCELVEEHAKISADRIHYAPYGVELPADAPSRNRNSEAAPIRIAWVGRLDEEQKRVSDIPKILRALDDQNVLCEMWVVGTGPEESHLRDQLRPWLENGRALMLGALTREDVYTQVYRQADVLLLTSSWETGPIVAWEAMSMGLPVVTSKYVGSGPEGSLVHGQNCLMYPIGDAFAAATSIAMLRNAENYHRLSAAGLQLVQSRYSIVASISAWDTVLGGIAASACKAGPRKLFPIMARGRLDHWVGVEKAESLRQTLGIRYLHTGAGGEWPHALSSAPTREV